MVLHQLYDQPLTDEDKEEVIAATIYIANYVIERFLFKFQDEQNEAYWQRTAAEKVKKPVANPAQKGTAAKSQLSEEELTAQVLAFYQRGVPGHGLMKTAVKFGVNREKVRSILMKAGKDVGDEDGV